MKTKTHAKSVAMIFSPPDTDGLSVIEKFVAEAKEQARIGCNGLDEDNRPTNVVKIVNTPINDDPRLKAIIEIDRARHF